MGTIRQIGGFLILTLLLINTARADSLVPTGDLVALRSAHSATPLSDGRVLIAGGHPGNTTTQLSSAEIYEPGSGTFSPTGSMNLPRWGHSGVLLNDGKVLIVGGWVSSFVTATATAEVYDPVTEQFTFTGNMSTPRADFPPVVKLSNGRIVVLGGTFEGGFGTATPNIDIYDSTTRTFTHVANLVRSRRDHAATLLQDGTALVAGGVFSCCNETENALRRASAEIYDPAANLS